MWPKAFAQLLELLPHITRLIPMADMFFTTKTATEKANEAALAMLAKEVRTDLGSVTSAHDGLYRQLQEHAAQMSEIASDTRSIRITVERDMERMTELERRAASMQSWLVVVLVFLLMLLVAVGGLIVLVMRMR